MILQIVDSWRLVFLGLPFVSFLDSSVPFTDHELVFKVAPLLNSVWNMAVTLAVYTDGAAEETRKWVRWTSSRPSLVPMLRLVPNPSLVGGRGWPRSCVPSRPSCNRTTRSDCKTFSPLSEIDGDTTSSRETLPSPRTWKQDTRTWNELDENTKISWGSPLYFFSHIFCLSVSRYQTRIAEIAFKKRKFTIKTFLERSGRLLRSTVEFHHSLRRHSSSSNSSSELPTSLGTSTAAIIQQYSVIIRWIQRRLPASASELERATHNDNLTWQSEQMKPMDFRDTQFSVLKLKYGSGSLSSATLIHSKNEPSEWLFSEGRRTQVTSLLFWSRPIDTGLFQGKPERGDISDLRDRTSACHSPVVLMGTSRSRSMRFTFCSTSTVTDVAASRRDVSAACSTAEGVAQAMELVANLMSRSLNWLFKLNSSTFMIKQNYEDLLDWKKIF